MDERQLLNARIGELLHAALVAVRNYTFPVPYDGEDRREEINDLADLIHNLPRYIVGHDEHAVASADQLRAAVVDHVRRFYPTIDPAAHRYVQLLDLDAETFVSRHKQHNWDVPTPAIS